MPRLGFALMLVVTACQAAPKPQAALECKAGQSNVDDKTRAELIAARDSIWKGWYAGDSAKITRILPERMVGMGQDRADIIREAQEFRKSGARLVSLTFTCDEFYVAGNVAVVWSIYSDTTEMNGKRMASGGRAIELFERRDGKWVNPSWHLDETR